MFIVKYYLPASLLAFASAIAVPHWYFSFMLFWVSLSLAIVSVAYLFDIPGVFRKRENGSIPFYIMILLLPFFFGVQLYNSWARRHDSVPAIQEITPLLFLGCRLFPSDIDYLKKQGVSAIVDATSEFSGLDWSARDSELSYINIPILDHSSPHKKDLKKAVNWINHQIKNNKGVVVHCALGRGRSVLIVAAYLLASGRFDSVDEAMSFINKIRGTAQLNKHQYKKLVKMHKQQILSQKETVLLVVNPVSGGGSWQLHQAEIEQRLSVSYDLDCKLTSKELNAKQILEDQSLNDYRMIIACGGDGTVNEVASCLIGTDILMGIVPLGTTNALAHVLIGNQSKLKPIASACEDILRADGRLIDTAKCNDDVLLLVAGIGFEQQMISSADRANKDEAGELAYLEGLSAALKENQSREYQVSFDDQAFNTITASSIVVANAAPFTTILAQGGHEPDPTDGLLDVTILNTKQGITIPLLALLTKGITRHWQAEQDSDINQDEQQALKEIDSKKVTCLCVRATDDQPIDYAVDGEVRRSDAINIRIVAQSLRVAHSQILNEQT